MGQSITMNLLERRVPQYLAAYLAGSWIIVEFFAFLEERFLLSPHLTNLVLLLLLLMLPSVAMFTYFHGRRGPDRWRRAEKVFIPLNVVATACVLAALFAGKDLGAMTTTVTVEGPDGETVERTVAKSEFRKSLLLFPFEVEGEDADAGLAMGVLNVLAIDLAQDSFIDARPPALFRQKARIAGYEINDIPRALKRRIARDMGVARFMDGAFAVEGSTFTLSVVLHDAVRGGVVAERQYQGGDLLGLIDEAASRLRSDLGLPSGHIEQAMDLPARDHATDSVEALAAYGEGNLALLERDDYPAAQVALKRAVELDPTYAAAAFNLYQLSILSADMATGTQAIRLAMDHLYRMPERFQFAVRGEWYAVQRDLPKAFAVYEMWAELYPQDLDAQLYSAQVRAYQGDRAGTLEAFEKALSLDPTRLDVVEQVGQLNEQLGRPEPARAAYQRIISEQPDSAKGFMLLAQLESRLGDQGAARALYERASLLESGNVDLITAIGDLDTGVGEFDKARDDYARALAAAKTPEQRYSVLRALRNHHAYRGAYVRALDYQLESEEEATLFQAPLAQVQIQLLGLRTYVHAGRTAEALQRMEQLIDQLQAPLDSVTPIGRIAVYEAAADADALEAALEDARAMLERTGLKLFERDIVFGQGRLHEIRGEWQAAISAFEEERRLSPTDTEIPVQLGRVYRAMGDLRSAEAHLREALMAHPSHGRANYELALVYEQQERIADARLHLEQAVNTWATADESYVYAGRAREMLAGLGQGR